MTRPALQILADHPEFAMSGAAAEEEAGFTTDAAWHDAEKSLTYEGWRTVQRLANPGQTVQIAGASHMGFMDLPFLPLGDDGPVSSLLAATTIQPERMWRITSDVLLAFFALHVLGSSDTRLDRCHVAAPEITLGAP